MSTDPTATSPPDVSAVMATLDRPEMLRRALRAIYDQDTDATIEAIVVYDDGEPDESLYEDFAGERLQLLTNTRTKGLAGARNTGTLASEAEWVAFCDDDDAWLPHRLSSQLALTEADPDCDFLTGGLLIDHEGTLMPRPHDRPRINHHDLLLDRVAAAHPSTFLFRREPFLDLVGLMDEELFGGHATDYDLLLRYTEHRDVLAVQEPIVHIAMHMVSYFGSKWGMKVPALDRMLDKHDFASAPTGEARIRGQRAFALAASGERGDALRESARVLQLNWREKRAPLAIAVSLGLLKPNFVLAQAYKRGKGI